MGEEVASFYDETPFNSGHTYSGHPLSMAAGMGTLDAFETGDHFRSGFQIEKWLGEGLDEIQSRHPIVGDVRGIGAFFAIELVKDRETKEPVVAWQSPMPQQMNEFCRELMLSGLWLYTKHNLLIFAPPLICTQKEIEIHLGEFEEILSKYEERLVA